MIDPDDDDEYGEGTGSPCDKVIDFIIGCLAIFSLIVIAYFLTR